eukprot:scaffold929_cov439-Pavlova_lutheri.AAC.3
MRHRRPLNEAIASMLGHHTLGSLSRAIKVKRKTVLEARKPTLKELEIVEKYSMLDSEYLGLCHVVWGATFTTFPSRSFLQSALHETMSTLKDKLLESLKRSFSLEFLDCLNGVLVILVGTLRKLAY